MTALQKLHLNSQTGAKITDLPVSWTGMISLEELYVYQNNIVTLPASYSGMTELLILHLHQNSIVSPLPPEWSNMGNLVEM